jgi:hypothetical protein
MEDIEKLSAKCESLKKQMHEAPLNKIFMNHDGTRHLGTHSTAWADRSREWAEAKCILSRARAAGVEVLEVK